MVSLQSTPLPCQHTPGVFRLKKEFAIILRGKEVLTGVNSFVKRVDHLVPLKPTLPLSRSYPHLPVDMDH